MEVMQLATGEKIVTHESGRQFLVPDTLYPAPPDYYAAQLRPTFDEWVEHLKKLGLSLSGQRVVGR